MHTAIQTKKAKIMEQRWKKLDQGMEVNQFDAIIIYGKGMLTEYGNLFYYGGYYPIVRHGFVIYVKGQKPIAYYNTRADYYLAMQMGTIEDVRYVGMGDVVHSENGLYVEIAREINDANPSRVGIVGLKSYLKFEQYEYFTKHIKADVVDATGMMEDIKLIKSEEEIDLIRQSFALAEKSYETFKDAIRSGRTSSEIAGEIERVARGGGAIDTLIFVEEGPYFLRKATQTPLSNNALVTAFVELIDENGYWVEKGGLFVLGEPPKETMNLANACVAAMKEVKQIIKAGITVGEVADAIHKHTDGLDVKMGIWHGHGVGVDHDNPIIRDNGEDKLEEGMVISVHPNFSDANETVGASIADVFVVRKDGAESLSKLSYDITYL
ncbi:M24 family metallopeptidase [Neobacillus kokaensis]|uniref:Peptidase M24 n=1 Tax=Neobacillus kokaensis TaxID=2759023 RepID=A0ABQ3N6X8_9BACI|nr:M24 family metallopeptidase [Neobacillus kokaensis]GHH99811.1 peptidase M24 [Neobacillus kokaensis]